MDCIGDIVILADHEDGIMRCNRALRDFTGKSYQEIMGKNWKTLLAENGLETSSLRQSGAERHHERTDKWFAINCYPFPGHPPKKNSGSVIIVRDVTEAKRLTRELEDAYAELESTREKVLLQEKMACIGRLAAGVAHEINNPMSYIFSNLKTLSGYVGCLADFIQAQSDLIEEAQKPDASELLRKMKKNINFEHVMRDAGQLIIETLEGADRVKTIVRDLKNFSRTDEAEQEDADINECITSAMNMAWGEMKHKATMVRNLGSLPRTICNPRQLNQVFLNLLANAAQAIEKHGEVTVRTWHENGSIYISIADTGCGIPPFNLSRVFEPFFTTKETDKGTGLGLSISYDIIRNHNGEIVVESEVGRGTSFTVRLPVVNGTGHGRKNPHSLR